MTKASAARVAKRAEESPPPFKLQTVVHKPGEIVEFTPEEKVASGIVYLFRVLDLTGRANYRRDLYARRGVEPDRLTINQVLRDGVEACLPEAERAAAIARIDAVEDFQADPNNFMQSVDAGKEVYRRYAVVQQTVRRLYPQFTALEGDIQFATQISNLVVLQHTLAGWRGIDSEFAVNDAGLASEASIMAIPDDHFFPCIRRAYDVVALTAAKRKN